MPPQLSPCKVNRWINILGTNLNIIIILGDKKVHDSEMLKPTEVPQSIILPSAIELETQSEYAEDKAKATPNSRPVVFGSLWREVATVFLCACAPMNLVNLLVSKLIKTLPAMAFLVGMTRVAKDFEMTQAETCWIAFTSFLISGCFLLFGGRLADIYGRKKLLVSCYLLAGAWSVIGGFAGNKYATFEIALIEICLFSRTRNARIGFSGSNPCCPGHFRCQLRSGEEKEHCVRYILCRQSGWINIGSYYRRCIDIVSLMAMGHVVYWYFCNSRCRGIVFHYSERRDSRTQRST